MDCRAWSYSDIPAMADRTCGFLFTPNNGRPARMQLDQNQGPPTTYVPDRFQSVGFGQTPVRTPSPAPAAAVEPAGVTTTEPPKPRRPRVRKQPNQAIYMKLPSDLVKNLKLMAVAEDRTQSDIASQAIREFVGEWVSPYKKNSAAA
jgi:hypothetical protein